MLGVNEAIQPDKPILQPLVPKQLVFATIIFVAVSNYAALGNEINVPIRLCSPFLFLLVTQRSLEGKEVQGSFHPTLEFFDMTNINNSTSEQK